MNKNLDIKNLDNEWINLISTRIRIRHPCLRNQRSLIQNKHLKELTYILYNPNMIGTLTNKVKGKASIYPLLLHHSLVPFSSGKIRFEHKLEDDTFKKILITPL
ncbi:hypothetical protein [Metabacillus sp. Hm71]|uniref:hypothetical protein n=1 Tax=Metabacillus sp. Hm71 TaxID=3450743 RepID=UPI003F42B288